MASSKSRRFVPFKFAGIGVRVSWGESLEDVGPVESLEAEIEQADRYLKLSYES